MLFVILLTFIYPQFMYCLYSAQTTDLFQEPIYMKRYLLSIVSGKIFNLDVDLLYGGIGFLICTDYSSDDRKRQIVQIATCILVEF
jgi:hypothetical protein